LRGVRAIGGNGVSNVVPSAITARVPPRVAAFCGLLTPLTSTVGWLVGGYVQRNEYSSLDDDISDLGALTASHPWIYNQIGANLTGLLVIVFALGLWRTVSPDVLGRVGAGTLLIVGLGGCLDGLFRLDCQGIDAGCENDSWHSGAHRMEGRFTTAAVIAAPIILAFAFRRLPRWRDTWIPTLAAIPASLAVGIAFSGLGDGAAVRATTLTWFVWLAYTAFQLLWKTENRAAA
jgi:hypothetical protein